MIYTDNIHLYSPDIHELHAFAKKIGLKREWFQSNWRHPHYDLIGTKIQKALDNGAIWVSGKDMVRVIRGDLEHLVATIAYYEGSEKPARTGYFNWWIPFRFGEYCSIEFSKEECEQEIKQSVAEYSKEFTCEVIYTIKYINC